MPIIGRHRAHDGLFGSLRLVMAVMAFIVGASLCLVGGEWQGSAAFYLVNQLPIPWFVYGICLVLCAICVLSEYLRPIGYLVGAMVYSFFALLVWIVVLGGVHVFTVKGLHIAPNSITGIIFAASNLTTIAVLYLSALKHSIYIQVDPERHLSTPSSE